MSKKAIFEHLVEQVVLAPQTLLDGVPKLTDEVIRPSKLGHVMGLRVLGGDLTGVTVLLIEVLGQNDGGGYVNVPDKDGNDLVFTATKTIAGAELDLGQLQAALLLARLPFEDFRFRLTTTGSDAILAMTTSIDQLYSPPSTTDDDLVLKQFDEGDD